MQICKYNDSARKKLLLWRIHTMAYRYFIRLAYNGQAYSGWQVQPNGPTIQQWIVKGINAIAGIKDNVTGCGRTDAGVHASVFYGHFDHEEAYSAADLVQLTYKLNRFLPQDIVIFEIIPVLPGAHARFTALWRQYEYRVIREKDPFYYQNAYLVHGNLDVAAMNQAAVLLLGVHNFECFSKVNTQVNNFICDVKHAFFTETGHHLTFTIRADRFLRNMVRAIVGTLLDVGRGRLTISEFQNILDSRNRCKAGYSVPAKGLTLNGIGYPNEIFSDTPVYFDPSAENRNISHFYDDGKS